MRQNTLAFWEIRDIWLHLVTKLPFNVILKRLGNLVDPKQGISYIMKTTYHFILSSLQNIRNSIHILDQTNGPGISAFRKDDCGDIKTWKHSIACFHCPISSRNAGYIFMYTRTLISTVLRHRKYSRNICWTTLEFLLGNQKKKTVNC